MICSIADCGKNTVARGWCRKHYTRWWNHGDPNLLLRAENGEPAKWLLAHVLFDGPACLTWPFGYAGAGYASPVTIGDRTALACIFMCEAAHGAKPSSEHEVAHSCGNGVKRCIHPKHIRWATPAENDADKDVHGTRVRGTNQPAAKLDEAAVRLIRQMTESQQLIAKRFGVSRSAIRQVLSGKTWSHVQ